MTCSAPRGSRCPIGSGRLVRRLPRSDPAAGRNRGPNCDIRPDCRPLPRSPLLCDRTLHGGVGRVSVASIVLSIEVFGMLRRRERMIRSEGNHEGPSYHDGGSSAWISRCVDLAKPRALHLATGITCLARCSPRIARFAQDNHLIEVMLRAKTQMA